MRRRDFIKVVAGAAAIRPMTSHAQQSDRMRRVGVLMNRAASDPQGQARVAAFQQALQKLGWDEGRNVRIDIRWGEDKPDLERKSAAELIALAPDVVLSAGTLSVQGFQGFGSTFPIVFVLVIDPVGVGLVDNLAKPGGNVTGFMTYEYSIGSKWLELLKQISPNVTRVAVLRDAAIPSGNAQFATIQAVAQSFGVEVSPVNVRDAGEIERAVAAFARAPNGGLIVTPNASVSVHRDVIIKLAARHKLPAVYPYRDMVADGGLMSYAPDLLDQFRRAASYVDRILKGEKPADLPVQAPTKFELVINLKTAKALGLNVPASVLTSADEVID
jgi:putative tryptophan/tyrosine transport system substrate-binding protein